MAKKKTKKTKVKSKVKREKKLKLGTFKDLWTFDFFDFLW